MARALEQGLWSLRTAGVRGAARAQPEPGEDAVAVLEEASLFVVAGGVGGHASDRIASEIAVRELVAHFRTRPNDVMWPYRPDSDPAEIEARLVGGIEAANRSVYTSAQVDPARHGMATTLVAALIADGHLHIAHVGDSRAYRLRWGELARLTRDHSLLEELTAEGLLGAQQRDRCPFNYLTRAVGVAEIVDVAVSRSELFAGDRILLCTRRLCALLADEAIRDALCARGELGSIGADLADRARGAGAGGEVTVLIVEPRA